MGKTSKRRKSMDVKSMPLCLVMLCSCRDLIRKLTKGGNDNKLSVILYIEANLKKPHRMENPMIEFIKKDLFSPISQPNSCNERSSAQLQT